MVERWAQAVTKTEMSETLFYVVLESLSFYLLEELASDSVWKTSYETIKASEWIGERDSWFRMNVSNVSSSLDLACSDVGFNIFIAFLSILLMFSMFPMVISLSFSLASTAIPLQNKENTQCVAERVENFH